MVVPRKDKAFSFTFQGDTGEPGLPGTKGTRVSSVLLFCNSGVFGFGCLQVQEEVSDLMNDIPLSCTII